MNCLVCGGELEKHEMEPGLVTSRCGQCGGSWLRHMDYLRWRVDGMKLKEPTNEVNDPIVVTDSRKAKICPECGRILGSFKAANELTFMIDHCSACDGVWFDAHEWEALVQHNLHIHIPDIYTEKWQRSLREQARREYFQQFYLEKFGAEDYEAIKAFRHWVDSHPNRSMILAYLNNEDPYA